MFDARRKSTVVKHTLTGGTPRGGVHVWSGRTASLTPIGLCVIFADSKSTCNGRGVFRSAGVRKAPGRWRERSRRTIGIVE
jgi:hypothetical protein